MIVTCASCLTKFNLDDSKISPKGAKVRCSRCQHVFYVVPPPESKEEVIEDFESFAKYHEGLIEPGQREEAPPAKPRPESAKAKKEEETEEEEKEIEAPPPPKVPRKGLALEEERPVAFAEEERPRAEKPPAGKRGRVLPPPSPEEEEAEVRPARPARVSRKEKKGPSLIFALVIVLAILIFGIFYLWSELGSGGRLSSYVESPMKTVTALWSQLWGREKEGLVVGDLNGYEEKVGGISLYVIEGKVINQARSAKKHIKIKVTIFDQNKAKLAEREALCGLSLGRQDLKNLSPDLLKKELVVQPQTEADRVIPGGSPAPFMVVFKDLSSEAKEFKVDILEAPNQ